MEEVQVRVRRRRPRINVCLRAGGRQVPSPFRLPARPPRRPQPLSARPFGETRKKCVCFISNGSRPVGRKEGGRGKGRRKGQRRWVVRGTHPARARPTPPCRCSDRPPSELILSVRSFVRSPAPRSLVRFGVSLQFRRRAAARSVRLPRKSRDLIDQT